MGTGCGLNNNSCSGTFKFELKSGMKISHITTEFLGLLFRNKNDSFARGHDPKEDVTMDYTTNIISIEFEFNLENSCDPNGEDGLYVGEEFEDESTLFNPFNAFISSIIDFGGIPLVKYGLNIPAPFFFAGRVGNQFAGYIGEIAHNENPPLIRENTTLRGSFKSSEQPTAGNWDIGNWNTSNVTNMSNMFTGATEFDQDIGDWDTSSVTDMRYMFNYASGFDQDIGGWDTSKVTDMSYMFQSASIFNKDLSGWCVKNITVEPTMFSVDSGLASGYKPNWGTCPP